MRGFYKGLGPYLLHVTPNVCIVFLVYERIVAHYEAKDGATSHAASGNATKWERKSDDDS